MMKVTGVPPEGIGKTFHAITEEDYLVYLGDNLKALIELAKEHGEDVYWCCNRKDHIEQQRVHDSGYRDKESR